MIRLLFISIILIGIDVYAFEAIKGTISSHYIHYLPSISIVYYAFTAITITFIAGLIFRRDQPAQNRLFIWIRSFFLILVFSKFLVCLVLFGDDLRRLFIQLINWLDSSQNWSTARSEWLSKTALVLGGISLISLTYGMIRNAHRYTVKRLAIKKQGLANSLEGLKIVQISDIHSGSFYDHNPLIRAVDIINDLKPDLIFFTGDLVNNVASEIVPYKPVFSKLESRYGVYSILGNHDYGDYVSWASIEQKAKNLDQLKKHHRDMGWRLLLNESISVNIEDAKLHLIGVENYSASARFSKYGNLDKAFDSTIKADYRVLLSHDPSHWRDQVTSDFKSIDLTLSGHTHGMQFGIDNNWIKWSPVKYAYREWMGLYNQDHQHLYVNAGFGFLGYPGRVGILPEITVISLERP